MASIGVGPGARADDRLVFQHQAAGELEILHLLPLCFEATLPQAREPIAERRAHDEVGRHDRRQAGLALHDQWVAATWAEERLHPVGQGEDAGPRGVDDVRVATDRHGVGVSGGELEHQRRVVREQAVVGVQQGHEIAGREIEAGVPRGHHAAVLRVTVVDDAAVGARLQHLFDALFDAAVVDHDHFAHLGSFECAVDGGLEVVASPVEGDGDAEPLVQGSSLRCACRPQAKSARPTKPQTSVVAKTESERESATSARMPSAPKSST